MFCAKCGVPMSPEMKFCPSCGQASTGPQVPQRNLGATVDSFRNDVDLAWGPFFGWVIVFLAANVAAQAYFHGVPNVAVVLGESVAYLMFPAFFIGIARLFGAMRWRRNFVIALPFVIFLANFGELSTYTSDNQDKAALHQAATEARKAGETAQAAFTGAASNDSSHSTPALAQSSGNTGMGALARVLREVTTRVNALNASLM